MALAIIRPLDDAAPGTRAFAIEAGSNRFYRVAVGSGRTRQMQGVELMAEPRWVSPLQGPLAPQQMGRDRLDIPDELFERDAEWVQMMTYRTEQRDGPAVSRMVRSRRALPAPLALSASTGRVLSVPYSSARPGHSQAMFLEGFFNALQGLLPQIGSIVSAIAPASGGQPGGQAGGLLQQIGNPETLRLLSELITRISAAGRSTPAAPAAAVRASPLSNTPYSRAQIAPALLAALPALAPLLQQVLNPQTLQTIIDAPNRATQTIIDGLMRAANIGLEANKAQLDHLRALNPGTNDEGLNALLQSMSLSLSNEGPGLRYRRSERVKLTLPGLTSVTLAGRRRILFAAGHDMALDVAAELPRLPDGSVPALRAPVLELIVKDKATLRPVIVTQHRMADILASGPLAEPARASAADLSRLLPGHDYIASVSLVWTAKTGELRGATMASEIQIAPPLAFDRVEEAGEIVALGDPARYRDFWHKLWAGRFTSDMRRFEVEASYRYAAAPTARDANARLETEFRIQPRPQSPSTHEGRLKSGYEVSVRALNRLLPLIAPGQEPLPDEVIAALEAPDFAERLSLGARQPIAMRGIPGTAFTLWAYPSMRLARLVLQRPAATGAGGNVTALSEETVSLPLPAVLNLIGTRNQ